MVLIDRIIAFFKNKLVVVIFLIIFILVGFGLHQQNQKSTAQKFLDEKISRLAKDVESKRAELVSYSLKRSQIQQKVLSNYKLLNEPLKKVLADSDKIQFQSQKDFNDYEHLQNHIQNLIAKRIVQDLKSNNKDVKELEWSEKTLNEIRIQYSTKEIELSKIKNRSPVTFLSDVQLMQRQQSK